MTLPTGNRRAGAAAAAATLAPARDEVPRRCCPPRVRGPAPALPESHAAPRAAAAARRLALRRVPAGGGRAAQRADPERVVRPEPAGPAVDDADLERRRGAGDAGRQAAPLRPGGGDAAPARHGRARVR